MKRFNKSLHTFLVCLLADSKFQSIERNSELDSYSTLGINRNEFNIFAKLQELLKNIHFNCNHKFNTLKKLTVSLYQQLLKPKLSSELVLY